MRVKGVAHRVIQYEGTQVGQSVMPSDPDQSIQIKITVPRTIADRMKKIAKQRGMPVSQLMLQATIAAYPSVIEEDDQD